MGTHGWKTYLVTSRSGHDSVNGWLATLLTVTKGPKKAQTQVDIHSPSPPPPALSTAWLIDHQGGPPG